MRSPDLASAVIVCLLASAHPAIAHTTDGKPCPDVVEIDIRQDLEGRIGLPIFHDTTEAGDNIEIRCEDRFCYAHSGSTKAPIWVVQKMTRAIACGDNTRPSGWRDADVEGPKAVDEDYTHSGYARGHNAASDDFKSSREWMKQTFTFGNSVPQIQNGFNGSYWRFLEEDIKHLALSGRELYVITGPIPVADDGDPFELGPSGGSCKNTVTIAGLNDLKQPAICGGSNGGGPKSRCEHGVEVPAGMFKIVLFADTGRMFAYAASNVDHRNIGRTFDHHDDFIETWRVSVRLIEEATSIEFFPMLDKRHNEIAKNGCIGTPRH
ncbi:DNA/RNA non-specific endonuclease [uncultured Ruegeria sp.]|uniref:DNA/RNA non-specific endonuclease n=1 Tax=uncultured Ruegeria sp. TaxID=259304 RepID=UPI002626A12E|nr:DNA/RNA non-specific endonuclease [uncultured Ruegeria sp.]